MERSVLLACVVLVLQCTYLGSSAASSPYLYRATNGLGWEDSGGLYGGPITVGANHSEAANLTQVGIRCAQMDKKAKIGLDIHDVGYDFVTKTAVIQLKFSGERRHIFTTKLCGAGPPTCEDSDVNVLFALGGPTDGSYDGLGVFTMYNGKVYFTVDHLERHGDGEAKHTIEVRRLEGCEDTYPFTNTGNDFDVVACSKFVATLAESTIYVDGRFVEKDLMAVGDLLVVPGPGNKMGFVSHIQEFYLEYEYDYDSAVTSMPLVFARENGQPMELHNEHVPDSYGLEVAGNIPHRASVSYRDGTLCWTSFDHILCARWDGNGALKDVITALPASEVQKVCSGDGDLHGVLDHNDIVTGVTIAGASGDVIRLFFGCYTEEDVMQEGGAGFLRINKDGNNRIVEKVTDDDGPIYARSLFIACEDRPVGHGASMLRSANSVTAALLASLLVLACLFS